MNKAYLERMNGSELDDYANVLGIDTTKLKTERAKINLIEKRRERVGTIDVLGVEISIPIKRLHDKKLVERAPKDDATDEEMLLFLQDLLGPEQLEKLEEACTDEDGTVDIDAFSYAVAKIITSSELKNF